MSVSAKEVVAKFTPKANAVYRNAFEVGDALLQSSGITTPMRLAHFMAQAAHETGGFSLLIESGRHTEKSLGALWDEGNWHRYFENRSSCIAMAAQCSVDGGEALFNLVYGNRMGNGPAESGDGWKYRGRGVLQTTGRESYRKLGRKCGVDFEGNPEFVITAEHALKPALAEWVAAHCNEAADNNDIEVVTRAINGRLVGLASRKAWFAKIFPFVVGGVPVEQTYPWLVQAALHKRGYKSVKPDGDIGPITRTAILDYRVKNGLPTSPGLTKDLLLSLGIQ